MTVLISGKVCKKKFLPNQRSLFLNEIYWLKKLKNYDFVPKIYKIDEKRLTILISYAGEKIGNKNKPINWKKQLKKILIILKKNNCLHSDIKPDNLLVKNKKLTLIDFAQSTQITNLNENKFNKKRIFYDEYSINRINLSINNNLIVSNDLRMAIIWNSKYQETIEKEIKKNKDIRIIDKIKISKDFYTEKFQDRVFWIDQFYNKDVGKKTDKLKDNIFVYVIKSIDPKFKLNKMIFTKDLRIVDNKIFAFKKKIRENKPGIIHIADNFEEAKRNAIFISKSEKSFPAKYFIETQYVYKNKKNFFNKINRFKKLKYVVLRDKNSEKDDLDLLVNDYFLFKRAADCHSYKKKNLKLIANSGDPIEENGIKVSNYIRIKNNKIHLDVRYVGDNYYDANWQKKILKNRKSFSGYFVQNLENQLYTLMYHIIYHKGFIDKKYINFLKKKFKKKLNLDLIRDEINKFLKQKNYKILRPNDLTIPITYKFNDIIIKREIIMIKNQISQRNYSGANKMIFNIFKFQKFVVLFQIEILFLLIYNQYHLFKARFKKIIYKYISFKNE